VTKVVLRGLLLAGGVAVAGVAVQNAPFATDRGAAAMRPVVGGQVMHAGAREGQPPARPVHEVVDGFGGPVESWPPGGAAPASSGTAPRPEPVGETAPPQSSLARALGWLGLTKTPPEEQARTERTTPDGVRVAELGGGNETTSTAVPAAEQECRWHDLQPQAQGVTADVDFVGVLLKGQELEGRQFTGAELGDLKILVQWRNLFGHHRQRLELIAPDGSVYQSLSRPLTVSDVDAPVTTVVPVSGTWITRYGLYGSWCVDVFFDQDEKPVASRRVVISS
jgi:hypothetical protein